MSDFSLLQRKEHKNLPDSSLSLFTSQETNDLASLTTRSPSASLDSRQTEDAHAGCSDHSLSQFAISSSNKTSDPGEKQQYQVAAESRPLQLQRQTQTVTAPVEQGQENRSGLPDSVKAGVENLSGYSLNDVRVHYNSSTPAEIGALAYTQGTQIHIAPGQEQHLAHEAWHVVQQKQGRVKPTIRMQGRTINDDVELEREADVMGTKASQQSISTKDGPVKLSTSGAGNQAVVQCVTDYNSTVGQEVPFNANKKTHVYEKLRSKGQAVWHATFLPFTDATDNYRVVFNEFHITSTLNGEKLHHFYTDDGKISLYPSGNQAPFTGKSWNMANKHAAWVYRNLLNKNITREHLNQQLDAERRNINQEAEEQLAVQEEEPVNAQSWETFVEQIQDPGQRQEWQEWYDRLDNQLEWHQRYAEIYYNYSQDNAQEFAEHPPIEEESTQEERDGTERGMQREQEGQDEDKKRKKQKV